MMAMMMMTMMMMTMMVMKNDNDADDAMVTMRTL